MKKNIAYLFLLFATACGEVKKETTHNKAGTLVKDTTTAIDQQVPAYIPSTMFTKLAGFMDSIGYTSDTAFFAKQHYYHYYQHKPTEAHGGFIFYKLDYASHCINTELQNEKNRGDESQGNLTVPYTPALDSTFSCVQSIYGYLWVTRPNSAGEIPNGAIEEWEFANENAAKKAYDFLQSQADPISWPYFKIGALYTHCGKYMYIFHAMMTGYNYRNHPFEKWVKTHCR